MKDRYLLTLIGLLLLAGCGYHHPAARPVAAGAITIYAASWENRTNEIALEGLLLQKSADWLQQAGQFRLERDPARADYILSGTILMANNPATAFNRSDRATTLKAWVKVSYRLTEAASGKTLWEITDATRERNFPAGADSVWNRSNREEALAVIADELAERIYLKVVSTLSSQQPNPTD
ncbi:MAG: hypothetical protein HGA96_16820 [Desulfobulbaceae bacterium]|nr:hypothetical protein [Desulfobulbaceae bacterium]